MIEHSVNKFNNFISGWYVEDMIKMSDEIIYHFNNSSLKAPGVVRGMDGLLKVNDEVKSSTDIMLYPEEEISIKYSKILQKIVKQYILKYPFCNEYGPWACIQNINVQHYKPNQGFKKWHTERTSCFKPSVTRHLVFMTYLNDVTNGGETEFFHQDLKIKPEKGLTIIWPADWTFTHRGVPSPSQEKYIATGWFNYVDKVNLIED